MFLRRFVTDPAALLLTAAALAPLAVATLAHAQQPLPSQSLDLQIGAVHTSILPGDFISSGRTSPHDAASSAGSSTSVSTRSTTTAEHFVPGHLVVLYREATVPSTAAQAATLAGAHLQHALPHLGLAAFTTTPADEPAVRTRLLADPTVAAVLQDRYVTGHQVALRRPVGHPILPTSPANSTEIYTGAPAKSGTDTLASDIYYDSPQGWAIRSAGGYGDNIPGGPAAGPWNTTRGAGVRIAILDSGIDATHPDLSPNLLLNLTEIDHTALPSACDDGSPQDQQGHGTFAASLAAASIAGGQTVGVAPQASLLNIKVLQRMPASMSGTPAQQCEAGEPGGLLSWVLEGIEDAVSNHADIISVSLGTLVDLSTGDGAGWKASFDRATYAAQQSGAVIVAALGNDGLNLSSGTLAELPAQARGVLAVTAATNPACAENTAANATCAAGPITRASYSNYGATLNALAAPGGNLPQGADLAVSGFVPGACTTGLPNTTEGLPAEGHSFGCFALGHTSGYVQAMGTSAAAPLVAGAAALLHAARPDWTAAQIIAALRSSATQLPSMPEPQLNLPAALLLQAPQP